MKRILIACALAPALLGPAQSHAAVAIVAGPGSFLTTYTVPAAAALPDVPVELINTDIEPHDVVADDTRAPGTASWCPAGGGRCPLFFTAEIGIGGITAVIGLEDVPSGVYPFHCSPHPWMIGVLVVA